MQVTCVLRGCRYLRDHILDITFALFTYERLLNLGSFVFFVSCVSHAFASVLCCLVVTCWEWADLLALRGDGYCIFVSFPFGILGQEVWYLIASFTDLCRLSCFNLVFIIPKQ